MFALFCAGRYGFKVRKRPIKKRRIFDESVTDGEDAVFFVVKAMYSSK